MKTNIIFVLSENSIAQIVGDSINDAPNVGDILSFDDNSNVVATQFVGVQFRVVERIISYGKKFENLPGVNTILVILEFLN